MSNFSSAEPSPAAQASLNRLQEAIKAQQRNQEAVDDLFDPDSEAEISRLIKTLSEIKFTTELTDSENSVARSAMQNSNLGQTHKVHRLGGSWTVKFYLGRRQRCFGFYQNYVHAMRIADLLTFRYFNRRTRKILHPPGDDDFNITLKRAKQDAEGEHDIISLLCQIEALLPEKKQRARAKNVRKHTVGSEVAKLRTEIFAMVETLQELRAEIKRLSPNTTQGIVTA